VIEKGKQKGVFTGIHILVNIIIIIGSNIKVKSGMLYFIASFEFFNIFLSCMMLAQL